MKKILTLPMAFVVLYMLALAGCSTTGQPVVPNTPGQTLAAAYGTYIAMENTAADLVKAGTITPSQAQKVQVQLKKARTALDAARGMLSTNGPPAAGFAQQIQVAQQVLTALQQELQQEASPK